jgi:hypothetical protein
MRKAIGSKRTVILFVLTFVLMACATTSGQRFTINDANKVTNGMTREEVIATMGTNPSKVIDGGKVFIWTYTKRDFAGNWKSYSAKFSFDYNWKTYGVPEGGVYGDAQKYLDK